MKGFVLAFLMLGFLVGNLMGLSAGNTSELVIGLVFSFVGGTAFAIHSKVPREDRPLIVKGILGLSCGCLLGVYLSVFVTQHQLLSPTWRREAQRHAAERSSSASPDLASTSDSVGGRGSGLEAIPRYIFSDDGAAIEKRAKEIDTRVQSGVITLEQGYHLLVNLRIQELLIERGSIVNYQESYDSVYRTIVEGR